MLKYVQSLVDNPRKLIAVIFMVIAVVFALCIALAVGLGVLGFMAATEFLNRGF